MQELSREQAAARLDPVSRCLNETVERLRKEMLDAEIWESTDPDVLLGLAERLMDTIDAAHDCVDDMYHWLHQIVDRTPGLSRPMSL